MKNTKYKRKKNVNNTLINNNINNIDATATFLSKLIQQKVLRVVNTNHQCVFVLTTDSQGLVKAYILKTSTDWG